MSRHGIYMVESRDHNIVKKLLAELISNDEVIDYVVCDQTRISLVYLVNEIPVGYITARQKPDRLHISYLVVDKNHRRQNIGADLLNAILSREILCGQPVSLSVMKGENSERLIRFYAKFGFELVRSNEKKYRLKRLHVVEN